MKTIIVTTTIKYREIYTRERQYHAVHTEDNRLWHRPREGDTLLLYHRPRKTLISIVSPRYSTFCASPSQCTAPCSRQVSMWSVHPKYIQWMRRCIERGSGTGRKTIG